MNHENINGNYCGDEFNFRPDHDPRGHEGELFEDVVDPEPSTANLGPVSQSDVMTPGQLRTPDDALRFILAGNAYFTMRSKKTGNRYTYHINRGKCSRCGKLDCHCWKYPLYFVSVLTGPENTSQYTYLGIIKDNTFQRTAKSRMTPQAVSVRAFDWVYRHLVESTNRFELPMDVEIWHEGRCGRCGRKLTVPESIERGIGPDCAGRMS